MNFKYISLLSTILFSSLFTQTIFAQNKFKFIVNRNPTFFIQQNNAAGVLVSIGEMPLHKSAGEDASKAYGSIAYSYSVKSPTNKDIIVDQLITADMKLTLAPRQILETGAYTFSIKCVFGELDMEDYIANPALFNCWEQDIYVYSQNDRLKINSLKFDAIAKDYAPVLMFAPDEQYLPTSLAYIFNLINTNPQLAKHKLDIRDTDEDSCCDYSEKVKFADVVNLVRTKGNKNFLIDMGYEGSISIGGPSEMSVRYGEGKINTGDKANVIIYYSVIPSRNKSNIFYLNYHFLYAYDSKGGDVIDESGSTGAAGHAFDRESVTIKMQASGTTVTPVSVIYGAHLPDQTMGLMDDAGSRVKLAWLGGAVELPWEQALKADKTKHPLVSIAHGSHGVYPKPGVYAVIFNGIPLLKEEAGSGDIVLPQDVPVNQLSAPFAKANVHTQKNYQLRNLDIMDFNPKSDTSLLSFSGYWVTIFFGKPDAKFPPFTNREVDADDYSARASKPGQTYGLPAFAKW